MSEEIKRLGKRAADTIYALRQAADRIEEALPVIIDGTLDYDGVLPMWHALYQAASRTEEARFLVYGMEVRLAIAEGKTGTDEQADDGPEIWAAMGEGAAGPATGEVGTEDPS